MSTPKSEMINGTPPAALTNGHHDTHDPNPTPSKPPLYERVDTAQLWKEANTHLLRYSGAWSPAIITRASGSYIYTSTGHRVLDWTSGQMSCLIGHGHPDVVETIRRHAQELDHLFSGMVSPPVISLARTLTELLPAGLDRAMFLSTGGESNEVAIKLAKHYTGKYEIVGLTDSWHGMTGGAQAAQYKAGRHGGGPLIPGNHALPAPNAYRSRFRNGDGSYDWRAELEYGWAHVDRTCAGSLAAVIIEPILSSGGILTFPPGYMVAMKEECRKRGMLLIVDEAQTGIGRTGDWFAFEHEGCQPDILTLSKTLGNGLPLSAVITSDEIERKAVENGFMFYTTHMNDPLPAAVGSKVIEVVKRDELIENSRKVGQRLHDGLRELQKRYGCVGDVRGRCLMAGVEIVGDRDTKSSATELSGRLAEKMMKLGLNANLSNMSYFAGVFRIAPPITSTIEEIEEGLAMMEEAFCSTEGSQPLY